MASLSLPRVLQQRKTSLELERESFEKFQAASINKAINQIEHPVKEKHVRSAILGTFNEKCAETFWICVQRLPLLENRIVAWKFCHVLHKILREGHPQVIPNSQRHSSRIDDIGKLWGHLREGYGKLIHHYCKLLLAKLDFHKRNPRFPGNLVLSKEELDRIGENDINNYFQMSVEMFDYMDEILALQSAIFGSLDMSRSNSMTSSGQCRLAPLIPIIQDSSQLYDFCVKILFKLHASLTSDVLSGHRQRLI
uniref:ENTH domain-containing protein n=1 Tax=Clastoptera arizonana TaxID=38151 RepID=A0A1B6E1U0_9HEMI